MTEANKTEKTSVLSRTWVKVTAGVLGGTLILSGTFVTGAIAGAKFAPASFDRVAAVANFEERQQSRVFLKTNDRGQGMKGRQESMRGEAGFGMKREHANLSEEERLEKINQWLESIGVEPLEELPEELSGTAEELNERRKLEMINKRLERLGIETLDELPETEPNS
jgi:hypothetical protein